LSSIDRQDLSTLEGYLSNFWMFLGLEPAQLKAELQRERNADLVSSFASDFSLRFLVMQKVSEKEVRL
jgi:hypothetical protein